MTFYCTLLLNLRSLKTHFTKTIFVFLFLCVAQDIHASNMPQTAIVELAHKLKLTDKTMQDALKFVKQFSEHYTEFESTAFSRPLSMSRDASGSVILASWAKGGQERTRKFLIGGTDILEQQYKEILHAPAQDGRNTYNADGLLFFAKSGPELQHFGGIEINYQFLSPVLDKTDLNSIKIQLLTAFHNTAAGKLFQDDFDIFAHMVKQTVSGFVFSDLDKNLKSKLNLTQDTDAFKLAILEYSVLSNNLKHFNNSATEEDIHLAISHYYKTAEKFFSRLGQMYNIGNGTDELTLPQLRELAQKLPANFGEPIINEEIIKRMLCRRSLLREINAKAADTAK